MPLRSKNLLGCLCYFFCIISFFFISAFFLSYPPPVSADGDEVTFRGLDKDKNGEQIVLSATLTRPEGKGPFPAVVMMHGCGGDNRFLNPWEKRLASWGYVVLRLDSLTPRKQKTFCIPDHLATSKRRAQDAHDAKSYLAKLPFVDRNHIALMGWSHGGTAVLYAVDAGFDIKNREEPFIAAVAFYPYCTRPLIRPDTPLLVFVGGRDEICRAENCKRALGGEKSSHEITLKEYKNAYHCFDWEISVMWNGNRLQHNPEAAVDAVNRTERFLRKRMK